MNSIAFVLTAAVAFILTAVLGIWLIPFLKKLKYGQTINDIGPTWHKNKQGTPTMGGILFIIGVTVAAVVGFFSTSPSDELGLSSSLQATHLFSGLFMALAYGFLGFIDDYIKVVKKRNLGLTVVQKTVMQVLIAVAYLLSIYVGGDTTTVLIIPFIGQLDLGILYYPFMVIMIYGWVNAVNITDGIDGLCTSVTFFVAVAFVVISGILHMNNMTVLAVALAGASIGFLVWNFYPAKVFMGDTGSMFLGGLVVALSVGTGLPLFIFFIGVAYFIDVMSVVLQVASFKLRGKRIFKMSPIHHSFEMSGYSEVKIVALFSAITIAGCVIAVIAVLLM